MSNEKLRFTPEGWSRKGRNVVANDLPGFFDSLREKPHLSNLPIVIPDLSQESFERNDAISDTLIELNKVIGDEHSTAPNSHGLNWHVFEENGLVHRRVFDENWKIVTDEIVRQRTGGLLQATYFDPHSRFDYFEINSDSNPQACIVERSDSLLRIMVGDASILYQVGDSPNVLQDQTYTYVEIDSAWNQITWGFKSYIGPDEVKDQYRKNSIDSESILSHKVSRSTDSEIQSVLVSNYSGNYVISSSRIRDDVEEYTFTTTKEPRYIDLDRDATLALRTDVEFTRDGFYKNTVLLYNRKTETTVLKYNGIPLGDQKGSSIIWKASRDDLGVFSKRTCIYKDAMGNTIRFEILNNVLVNVDEE